MTAIIATSMVQEAQQEEQSEVRTLKQIAAEVQNSNEPRLLTIEDETQIVCLSVAAYQALLDRIELLDSVSGLYQAELECERGEDRDAREAFEELRLKLGIPR